MKTTLNAMTMKSVVRTAASTRRSVSGVRRSWSGTIAGLGAPRNPNARPTPTTTPSPASIHMGSRHVAMLPKAVPSGVPIAPESVNPALTRASARPRRSDGTKDVATALAVGTSTAPPSAAIALPSKNPSTFMLIEATTVPMENSAAPTDISTARETRASTIDATGAAIATMTAYTVME